MSHDALALTAPLTPDDGGGKGPDRIGPYRVLRRLGAGGMGTVFLVDDPATGARRALKALPAGAPLDARLRFRREGEAMARVDDHPAVVRVHSAGEADGRAYLLMDAVTGGDLHARLARGPLPPDEVLRLGRTLARGLAHVHARGVLHRDLKPHNVLFDEAGAPRLVDFGLAQVAQAERLTATGTLLGTPAYMAPEQADARATDERTDVHGLGAVLYHALTGRPPFQGGSPVAVLAQVLEQEPAPPSSLVPGVPPALEQVVLRALAKAPAARFASASALADALDAAAAGVAPPRRRAPLRPGARRPRRARRARRRRRRATARLAGRRRRNLHPRCRPAAHGRRAGARRGAARALAARRGRRGRSRGPRGGVGGRDPRRGGARLGRRPRARRRRRGGRRLLGRAGSGRGRRLGGGGALGAGWRPGRAARQGAGRGRRGRGDASGADAVGGHGRRLDRRPGARQPPRAARPRPPADRPGAGDPRAARAVRAARRGAGRALEPAAERGRNVGGRPDARGRARARAGLAPGARAGRALGRAGRLAREPGADERPAGPSPRPDRRGVGGRRRPDLARRLGPRPARGGRPRVVDGLRGPHPRARRGAVRAHGGPRRRPAGAGAGQGGDPPQLPLAGRGAPLPVRPLALLGGARGRGRGRARAGARPRDRRRQGRSCRGGAVPRDPPPAPRRAGRGRGGPPAPRRQRLAAAARARAGPPPRRRGPLARRAQALAAALRRRPRAGRRRVPPRARGGARRALRRGARAAGPVHGDGRAAREPALARRARHRRARRGAGPQRASVSPVRAPGAGGAPVSPPRVPGHRLLERLGEGGMGAVWLAVDERTGARRAVKVLAAGADAELRLRFRREAEAMARVDGHPHVVRVHAAGEGPDGCWLVMDLAEGGDLAARLRRGPLPPDDALALGRALARALAHLHAHGVFHRDLKPANVLFDAGGAPRLVDFGLAALPGAERLTQTGAVLGTPVYMAPEQALGQPLDERADVYGLGAVLYHALTGRAPVPQGALVTVLAHVVERRPTPPSAVAPATSPAFEAAVLRALAKAPEDRFPSAEALARALDAAAVAPHARPAARVPGGVLSRSPARSPARSGRARAALALLPGRVDPPVPAPSPPPASSAPVLAPLPLERLERALLADDPGAGLLLLNEACPEADDARGAPWATAFRLLADDDAALADLADLQAASAALEAWSVSGMDVASDDALAACLAPLRGLVAAASGAGGRAARRPDALAARVLAQRWLCARRVPLIYLAFLVRARDEQAGSVAAVLAEATDLAPGSAPGLGLRVILRWTREASAGWSDAHLLQAVEALDPAGPYAWVRGLLAGVWLTSDEPFAADLDLLRARWGAFRAFAAAHGALDDVGRPSAEAVPGLDDLLRQAANRRSEVLFSRAFAARGGLDGPALLAEAEEALVPMRAIWHRSVLDRARLDLFQGRPDEAEALLASSGRWAGTTWFRGLRLEAAIAAGDPARVEALLPGAPAALLPLWRAALAALRGDHEAAAAIALPERPATEPYELTIAAPWRTPHETRRLLEALRRGEWRPGGRPFVDP
ncbi:MAG: serine/threonine protein kinase [Planctomycetes bacterium]|nr:serine/threonine protein kinase [Planctomycetota bacterium]